MCSQPHPEIQDRHQTRGHTRSRRERALWAWLGVVAALSVTLWGCGDDTSSEDPGVSTEQDGTADVSGEDSATLAEVTEEADTVTAPDVTFPLQPVEIDTVLRADVVAAGQVVEATCVLLDEAGEVYGGTLTQPFEMLVSYAPESSFVKEDGQWVAVRAGQAQVACSAPALRLVDTTPAALTITPGPAYSVITELDPITIRAGEDAAVGCVVFDAFGNEVLDASPAVQVVSGDGVLLEGSRLQITRAGVHEVLCHVDGAEEEVSQRLEVLPGLPYALALALVPDEAVYGLGQVITTAAIVTDRYGNVIPDAEVTLSSSPVGEDFGEGRFRFQEEGVYVLTAVVEGELDPDAQGPLLASRQVIVNGNGPQIACDAPLDGAMVNHVPGQPLTVSGSLADPNGVAALLVDGKPALINPDGTFSVDVATRFGMNFVTIAAEDSFGEQNTRTCTFLIADRWAPEANHVDDLVTLRLKQAAFDDGSRSGPINSVADLLHVVINSQELRNTIHAQLSANPELKPLGCDQTVRVCVPFTSICTTQCVLRSSITYRNFTIAGPNTVALTLVDPAVASGPGGLRARVVLRNAAMTVHAYANQPTLNVVLIDRDGTVSIDDLTADITLNVFLQSGQPRVTIRSVNEVRMGNYSVSIQGIPQFLLDILLFFLEGTIRNVVEDQLEQFITGSFSTVVDGLLDGLDVSTLGSTFEVPRLDGVGNIALSFAVAFSRLEVTAQRALFGLRTRFLSAPITNATPSLGVPMPPQPSNNNYLDLDTARAAGVLIHIGMFNQVLHALWRGGLLDAQIGGAVLGGGLPDGLSATLTARLPPVASITPSGQVELGLGGLRLSLVYPGLFDEPLTLNIGALATASFSIQGSDLVFGGIQIQALYFSTEGVSLDATSQSVLQGFLISLLQRVVDGALNDALPALPIPSFELPASLAAYGLPAGAVLGLKAPSLGVNGNHFVLDSDFGQLP
jgi:hypothetical protein